MKKLQSIIIIILLVCTSSIVTAQISGDVYVTGVSKYLWRGQELFDKFAVQPGADLNVGPVSLGFWGSYSVDPGDLAEADITVSYSRSLSDLFELSLGYTFYTFPQPAYSDSHEFFAGGTLGVFLSPSLTLYYDVDDGDGLYAEAGASLPIHIGPEFSLDGSLGFNAGQWGYDSSLTVFGLGLSTTITAGPVDITPSVFGQLALDDQYDSDGFGSLAVAYNF